VSDQVVLVLAAMPRELRPLVRKLRLRPSSIDGLRAWRRSDLVAVAVGVGPARAGAGAARVFDVVRARRVVITGVAGGLDPSLKVGDLVRPATVVDVGSGSVHTPGAPDARAGMLATVDRVFLSDRGSGVASSPAQLPEGATAVDMETAAIAAVCEANGIPWDVVRAVSDVAGTLTPEVAALLRPDGRADLVAAARVVLHDPRALGRMVRLGLDTERATRAASRAVISELERAANRPGSG
jgi:adenosylhomocysteine nucleosidase